MCAETINITNYGYSILQVETVSVCNMQCVFCAYPIRGDKFKRLKDDVIYNVIDSLEVNDKFEYICFSQFNEPLLDKRIYDFIGYSKNRQLPVMIITNGLLFNSKDTIHRFIEANPDYVKVSVQTLSPRLFRESRGISSSFQAYKRGIFEFLKEARNSSIDITIDIACNFLSRGRNLSRFIFGLERGDPSIYNSLHDLRNDLRSFMDELATYDKNLFDIDHTVEDYLIGAERNYLKQEGFKIAKNISLKIKPFIYGRRLTDFYPIKHSLGCRNRILAVLANGNIVPCCLAYNDMLCMGNIQNDPLKTIMEESDYVINKIRNGIDMPVCCQKCLGAPTRRGAVLKDLKNIIFDKFNKN